MRQFQARPSNFNKSSITFGTKVNNTVKTKMRSLLGIHNDGGIGKYLVCLIMWGNKKSELFAYIVDKVKSITQSWKQRYLSNGGKEVLFKAIVLSLPILSMNIFRLPKEVCAEINATLARLWWGSGDKKWLHWYSLNIISFPKRKGGLGFNYFEIFNQAFLSKQV